jgi:hypothetical protein
MLVQHDPSAPRAEKEPAPAPTRGPWPPAPGPPAMPATPPAARTWLRVEPWRDPVIDQVGFDTRSSYVETFWLPVLGPSSVWLLRHFTIRLEDVPDGLMLDVEETARSLGLGERLGPNAPFARTVKRCVDFAMAEWRAPEVLAVRLRLPPLARRHLRRLPDCLQTRHESAQIRSLQSRYESVRPGPIQSCCEVVQVGSVHDDQGNDLPRDGARARADL